MREGTSLPLKSHPQVLVVGIGSSHGDDMAGWEVVDRLLDDRLSAATSQLKADDASIGDRRPLALRDSSQVELRKASVPHDLLDWLEADRVTHLVDASVDPHAAVRRFAVRREGEALQFVFTSPWEPEQDQMQRCDLDLSQLRSNSTHRIGLPEVLQLASELGRLPQQLTLWTVSTEVSMNGGYGISEPTEERVLECAQLLRKALACCSDTS